MSKAQEYHIGDFWPLRWRHTKDGAPPPGFEDTDYYIQITPVRDRSSVVATIPMEKLTEDGDYTGELYGIVDAEVTLTLDPGRHLFFLRAVFPKNGAPGDQPFTLHVQAFDVDAAPGLDIS